MGKHHWFEGFCSSPWKKLRYNCQQWQMLANNWRQPIAQILVWGLDLSLWSETPLSFIIIKISTTICQQRVQPGAEEVEVLPPDPFLSFLSSSSPTRPSWSGFPPLEGETTTVAGAVVDVDVGWGNAGAWLDEVPTAADMWRQTTCGETQSKSRLRAQKSISVFREMSFPFSTGVHHLE